MFQSNHILIHKLYDSCSRLLHQLCGNYIKPKIIYCKNLSTINLTRPEYFLDLKKIKLGSECEVYLQSMQSEIRETVRKHCLAFYIHNG